MLFYHTRHVLERQNQRNNNSVDHDSDDSVMVMKNLIKLTRMMLMLMYNCTYFGCIDLYKYLRVYLMCVSC